MKNYTLFHGTSCQPDNFWYPWLAEKLRAEGNDVWVPQLPEADQADLSVWTPYVMPTIKLKDATIIGHSAGSPLTLSVINTSPVKIKRAILVAGFGQPLNEYMPPDHQTLLREPDWDKIKNNCEEWFFINSDNDPWGCDNKQGEWLRERLGGTLIVPTGEGHFGSAKFEQPYPTFPLLKMLCDL